MMLKTNLLATFLVLSACSTIPKPPDIEQLGYSVKFKKFRGCRTDTHQCRDIDRDDPSLEGAQALSAKDFKAESDWVDELLNALQRKKLESVTIDE
jgi:hypothetical protein